MKTKILLASLLAVALPLSAVLPAATAFADPHPAAGGGAPIAMPAPTTIGPPAVSPTGAASPAGPATTVAPAAVAGLAAVQAAPSDATATIAANTCGPDLQSQADATAAAAAAAPVPANAGPAIAGNSPSSTPDPTAAAAASSAPAAAAPPPKAADKVAKSCADDQIKMVVEARPFEYHFGDTVLVEVGINVASGAQIDLAPLVKQGHLYMVGNQQFELAGQPIVNSKKEDDGSTIYEIVMPVRQFLPAPFVKFYMQIPYSVANAPNGSPLWQVLQTPDFVLIEDAAGVQGMAQPDSGNAALTQPRSSWGLAPLAVLMSLLLLLWPVVATVRQVNRVIPRQNMPRSSQAWLALRRVRLSGDEMGYSTNHYGKMSQIVRQFLDASRPGLKSMTAASIERTYKGDSLMTKVASALAKIERVIVGNGKLSADEHKQLLAEVDEIVPRPNDM